MTYEMRALSTEEINAVAGAGGYSCPTTTPAPAAAPSGNTITVGQSNEGSAIATTSCGCATASNLQSNNSLILQDVPVSVTVKHK